MIGGLLTQEEINALLAAIAQSDNEGEGATEDGGERGLQGRVRPYDFGRPNKLSKEQLRTLQIMHEPFARGVAASLSAYLRSFVEAEVVSADAMLYEEFTRTVAQPGIMAIFSIPPLEGSIVLEVNPILGFSVIDRLLGGPGSGLRHVRELTELEQPVMRRVVERMMANLSNAWSHVISIDPGFERLELNPQFTQLVPPKDMVVVIKLRISLQGTSGDVQLCIPFDVIEPVVPKLSAHYLFTSAKKVSTPEQTQALSAKVMQMQVPIRVLLGEASVSLKELLDLQVGDFVPLETKKDGLLPVQIGTRTKFLARPGRSGARLAIELVCAASQEEDTVDDE